MTTINFLTASPAVQPGDLIPFFSTNNGDARRVSLSTLAASMQGLLVAPGAMQTQYFAPNASGFSVPVAPLQSGTNVYLLMTPTADFAAGTIILPLPSTVLDGQEVLVTSTHAVTALTVNGNGAVAVNGAPTALTANGFFRLRFDGVSQSWFRVG